IRFYGVIEAFRMPDNMQIDETLLYVKDTSPVEIEKLSPDGRKLIQDARDIVETARLMVQEKNADELDVDVSQAKKDPKEVLPVDKSKDDGRTAVRHLQTILSLVLTNSEVRKLLSDISLIGRDLLARGASKSADSLRPDQEALAHIDKTAPQDQFLTEGGRKVGPTETPVPETKVPEMGHTVAQYPREDWVQVLQSRRQMDK
ncbi:hypothetical protein PILCRDRAFT_822241, partial [Piloderma croceum F 1598]